jgi:hypothetical protein
LVEKHQIKVILTTHSPSTVALAPDSSIYVMRKQGPERLMPTSKDVALGILTSGVPTLSVNYENRRQVFVESEYDVQYYSALYQGCKPSLSPEISLVFIASGLGGSGNCDQVRSVVKQLVDGGNRTTLGVLDWDTRNVSSGAVVVLGEGERYSIENYLIDPILLGFLLIRERFTTPERLGLKPETKYVEMRGLSQAILQEMVDRIVAAIAAESSKQEDSSTIVFHYIGGLKIVVPKWFAHMHGHTLEEYAKAAFPPLQRYRNEPDLKTAILSKVVDDFPDLIPSAIISLFRNLQNGVAPG